MQSAISSSPSSLLSPPPLKTLTIDPSLLPRSKFLALPALRPLRRRPLRLSVVRAAVAIEKEVPENERPETFLRDSDGPHSFSASSTSVRARFERMIRSTQDEVCAAIEAADGVGKFKEDVWSRAGGGGGISRVLQDGGIWEKAGVNVSVVYGMMPPEAYRAAKGGGEAGNGHKAGPVPFFAAGISSMGDSQQENGKGKGKGGGNYSSWTMEESNELLQLMVDGINHGWRDANGVIGKQTVEHKILPALNAKLECQKTYSQYLSRLKWFKARYNSFSELMRFSSGFGWDPMTKRFTASEEVWDDYLKFHPTHKHFRTDTFEDYEDLRNAIGNSTAVGRNSIGLGDTTDARTHAIENLIFDGSSGTFIPVEDESSAPSPGLSSSPSPLPTQGINARGSLQSTTQRKRSRSNNVGNNNTHGNTEADVLDRLSRGVDSFASDFGAVRNLLEEREKESNIWDAIQETPNLDIFAKYAALDLLNTRAKRTAFWKMSLEERRDWVIYKMSQ